MAIAVISTTVISTFVSIVMSMATMVGLFGSDLTQMHPFSTMLWTAAALSVGAPLVIAPIVTWRHVAMVRALSDAKSELKRIASTDRLTGLLNRSGFDPAALAAVRDAQGARAPLTTLICDIDFFKRVNDTYGHEIGDRALQAFARALSGTISPEIGIVGRQGGEEFVAVLPGHGIDAGLAVAERVRQACARQEIDTGGAEPLRLTVSIGAAAIETPTQDLADLMRIADAALYEAKRGGRNRVVQGYQGMTPIAA